MPYVILLLTLVENEIGTELVDSVVGQMHSHIFLVLARRLFIVTCSETA